MWLACGMIVWKELCLSLQAVQYTFKSECVENICLWRRSLSWYVIFHISFFHLYQVHIVFYDLHQLVFCSRSGGHKTKWVGVGRAAGRLIGFWLFFRFLENTFDFEFYCSDIGNLKDIGNESGLRAHFGICLNNSVPLWWYLLVLFHSVQNFIPVFSTSQSRGA